MAGIIEQSFTVPASSPGLIYLLLWIPFFSFSSLHSRLSSSVSRGFSNIQQLDACDMPRADHQSSEPPVFDPAVAYMTLDVMALATITTLQVAPPPIPPSPSTLDVVTVRPSDNSSKRPSIATSHDPTTSVRRSQTRNSSLMLVLEKTNDFKGAIFEQLFG